MIVPFATNSYVSESLPISAQQMMNCYAEKEPQDAKSPIAILGAPGLTNFASVGTGPIRNMHVVGGVLYALSGGTLYSVDANGNGTVLGGTIGGSGYVPMSDNGTQLMMVNGTNGYVYAPNTGFQIVTDPNFNPASAVTFFDDYFVLNWAGTPKFFISNSLDGTTYNGLAFATAQVAQSNVVAQLNQQESLMIFTGKTVEVWYDAGTPIFPFQPILGSTIERGCAAGLTAVKEDNSVFMLGDDLIFYRIDQFIPRRISTHAIEDTWRSYTTVSDAYTFSYTWQGHKFIVLTFQSANATWVYDISTGLWHERESRDINNRNYGRWRGSCVANCYNKILVGDNYSGQIGYLDNSAFTEYGTIMHAYMVGPSMNEDKKRLFHSRFELDIQQGVGATTGQGSNPQIMLDWSDDGGRTFSIPQLWETMGPIGQYRQRLRWLRLGQAWDRRYRVQISDPVPRVVIAAHADIAVGM